MTTSGHGKRNQKRTLKHPKWEKWEDRDEVENKGSVSRTQQVLTIEVDVEEAACLGTNDLQ